MAEPAAKAAVEKVDPKEIVARANALAGVKACAITFSDGLSLAGELPEEIEANPVLGDKEKALSLRQIRPGWVQDGMVQVLEGVKAGDQVVTSGSLFIDRASRSD